MTNEEIKALLRDLSERTEADGEVKSKTVRITFDKDEPETPEREQTAPVKKAKKAAPVQEASSKDEKKKDSVSGGAFGGLRTRLKDRGKNRITEEPSEDASVQENTSAAEETDASENTLTPIQALFGKKRRKKAQKAGKETSLSAEPEPDQPEVKPARVGKKVVRSRKRKAGYDETEPVTEKDALEMPDDEMAAGFREPDSWNEETVSVIRKKTSADDETADGTGEPESWNAKTTAGIRKPEARDEETAAGIRKPEARDEETAAGIRKTISEEDRPASETESDGEEKKPLSWKKPAAKEEENPEDDDDYYLDDEDDDQDDEEASGSGPDSADDGDMTDSEEEPVLPDEGKKRTARVEPPDFESDASDFTMEEPEPYGEEEEDNRTRKERIRDFFDNLQGKGIGRRELIMILSGIILLFLIVTVLLSVLGNRRKKMHVTAEQGLTVTVEKEPESWCREAEVTLGIQTASPLQSISINGEPQEFSGGNRTKLKVDAREQKLQVMVVSEEKVLNAEVDIPKIDAEDPVINISSVGGVVTLDVTDNRSGVKEVWCGVVKGLSDVPEYHRYTGPFQAEKDTQYSYFAVDNAGNTTDPVVTNLTPAVGMTMSASSISLFPGDKAQLDIKASPVGAFLNNLEIINTNEAVATMDDTAMITALAYGETIMTASAAGLPSVSCAVRVQSEAVVTISAVGDILLGEDENYLSDSSFSTLLAQNGEEYFFENVRSMLDADDFTIGNYEGTLTTSTNRMWAEQNCFKGDPSHVEVLVDGSVEAVSLANDHSIDFGNDGFTDTQNCLRQVGVASIDDGEVLIRELRGIKVAVIGINAMNEGAEGTSRAEDTRNCIDSARSQGAQIVIVSFHWGSENEYVPNESQEMLAYTAIDAGADLVIGHHPKVLQRVEEYNGKYIAFSLGAFCYGGTTMPNDMDTVIFQETFHISQAGEITQTKINLIPCRMSSDPTWNNCQPTPVSGDDAQRIMNRLNGNAAITEEVDEEGNVIETTGTLTPGLYTQEDTGEMTPGLYTQENAQ